MLNHFFYSHSVWTTAAVVCFAVMVLPLLGLWFFHRLVDWNVREEDTSMVGLSYALCGGIFAVVLAFVAVTVYEAMDKSEKVASAEANSLAGIAFDTAGMPSGAGGQIRLDVNGYIDTVTEKEWPRQQAFEMDEKNFTEGWSQVRRLGDEIADYEPKTPGEAVVKSDMLRLSNELSNARRSRLLAASAHLPDPVWQMLIAGLVLVSVFIYLFGPHSYKIHMATTGMTMLSIGLIFTLIIALDYPFRGELSVDDDAYKGVREVVRHAFSPESPETPDGRPSVGREK